MSFTPAKTIHSSQEHAHKNLKSTVKKHLHATYQKPIAGHANLAFNEAKACWLSMGKPRIILDSACGTGESTRYLSKKYHRHLVVGLDQSEKRLSHVDNEKLPNNCLLLRSDCTDFWRLADQNKMHFDKHYLLYPNPYPKPQHLKRRWHGHPAFSSLLAISRVIELRTNWNIYAEEFLCSLSVANMKGAIEVKMEQYDALNTITAFEKKYKKSDHILWRVSASII